MSPATVLFCIGTNEVSTSSSVSKDNKAGRMTEERPALNPDVLRDEGARIGGLIRLTLERIKGNIRGILHFCRVFSLKNLCNRFSRR